MIIAIDFHLGLNFRVYISIITQIGPIINNECKNDLWAPKIKSISDITAKGLNIMTSFLLNPAIINAAIGINKCINGFGNSIHNHLEVIISLKASAGFNLLILYNVNDEEIKVINKFISIDIPKISKNEFIFENICVIYN